MNQQIEALAYTVVETAQALHIKPVTVYRLLARGLLKGSKALRHHRIAKTEVERFLRETSQ